MTETLTAASEVEVGVDPVTAFMAFTDEMDLWWVRGPINFFGDAARVVEVRCEAGVGGRILEVYDDRQGDNHLERARITAWEPGVRLAWDSSVDDVRTEVRFEPTRAGTRVVVEHRMPAGGQDHGGTSWSHVVPVWYAAWVARRDRVPHQQVDIARLALGVYYRRPAEAARFLVEAFGFEPASALPDNDTAPHGEYDHVWIEFHVGNSAIHVFPLGEGQRAGESPHVPWVYVDDLDAHFTRAKDTGATMLSEIHSFPGSKVYEAADLEGNRWIFTQARPTQR